MYSVTEYLGKSQRNRDYARSVPLDTPTQVGWAITALFYSALHAINAYFAQSHIKCFDHDGRGEQIMNDPKISKIYEDYRELRSLSQNARYHMQNYGRGRFHEAEDSFTAVEDHITALIHV